MNHFKLITQEQQDFVEVLRVHAEKELRPVVAECDEKGEFPMEVFKKFCEAGLYGLNIPEQYGGMGLDLKTRVILHEELGKVDAGFSFAFFINGGNADLVLNYATDEKQKEYIAKKVLEEHAMISVCITEPNAGSDAASMTTTAVKDGDDYILNGTKCFISGGPVADIFIICAKTDKEKGAKGISLFIVEKGDGIQVGKEEEKLGIRLSSTSEVVLQDVRVPASRMIGREGEGFKYIMGYLEHVRFTTMACGLGTAQRALDLAVDYARTREQFGQPIIRNQSLAFRLSEIHIRIAAARAMLQYAAAVADEKLPMEDVSPSTKVFVSDTTVWAVNEALQVFGGYGYMKEYPMEKLYRDARIFPIFEGTNEIQKLVVARLLEKTTKL
ncbi:MAG: acyl-CoA dehydrogenase family protein [Lachnospiraceae bacterium]|nr:acyl-CoA dehydrogenase family protein [Lachnospiraceae bacterium]